MKLLIYESYKLLLNKLFIVLFVLISAGSLVSFVWAQLSVVNSEEFSEEKSAVQNRDEYNSVITELNELDDGEAVKKAQEQKKLYEMCMMISAIMSSDNTGMNIQPALDELKIQDEDSFNKAIKLCNESTDFKEKFFLYDCMIKKYQYIKNYRTFINDMDSRADRQLSFSIFSDNDAFSEAKIKKTVSDFAPLKGTEVKTGNYLFAEHGTSHFITDLMAISVMFLLCMCLFMQEREKGLLLLVKSCRNGHTDTAVSKVLTLVLFTFITVIVFYGTELVASGIIYGLPDMNAPVQSTKTFMDCSLKISVGQYLIIWLLSKLLILLTIALLFSVIFNLFRSTVLVWLVSIGILAAEYTLYISVPPQSSFNHPHFINLFYFLDSKTLLADYENLNIFSNPVNTIDIFRVLCISLILVSAVIVIMAFSLRSQIAKKSMLSSLIEKLKRKFLPIHGSTSVFIHELYKRLIHDKGIIVLAVLFIFAIQTSNEAISFKYDSIPEATYYAYLEQLEGRITPEKEQFIEKEQKRFDDLQNEFFELEIMENKTPEENSRLRSIDTILKGKYKGFQMLMEQYDYLKHQHEQKGTEKWFVNEKKYSSLLTDNKGKASRFILCAAALTLLTANVFSIEYRRSMKRLLRSTPSGKGHLFAVKYITALLCGAAVFLLVYTPVLIRFLNNWGNILSDAPVSSLRQFSELGNMTIGSYSALSGILYFILSIMIAAFVCSLSELTRNHFLTLLLSSVAILTVYFLMLGNSTLRFYAILGSGKYIIFIIGTAIISGIIILMTLLSNRLFLYDNIGRNQKWSCK